MTFPLIGNEFEKFLEINKIDGSVSAVRDGLDPGGCTGEWQARVDWPDGPVRTRYIQLGWRDIIRSDFERPLPVQLIDAVRSFWKYTVSGGYGAVIRSNLRHAIFCLYPPVGLLLLCFLCVLPPLLIGPWMHSHFATAGGLLAWSIVLSVSALWIAGVYWVTRLLEPRSYFWYLVNSWHFMANLAENKHPAILKRVEEFADLIVGQEARADADEELVFVAHSCGTFLAIYVLAAVLKRHPDIGKRPGGFAFVTLGPAFDCLGGFGAGRGYGQAMATVAQSCVDWTDLYGPHDFVCGGRTDPVKRYALKSPEGSAMPEPRRFSVCIPDRMPEAQYRYLRWRFFKLHFVYFLASHRPGLFDFHRLLNGPKPAREQLIAWANGYD